MSEQPSTEVYRVVLDPNAQARRAEEDQLKKVVERLQSGQEDKAEAANREPRTEAQTPFAYKPDTLVYRSGLWSAEAQVNGLRLYGFKEPKGVTPEQKIQATIRGYQGEIEAVQEDIEDCTEWLRDNSNGDPEDVASAQRFLDARVKTLQGAQESLLTYQGAKKAMDRKTD